MPTLQESEEKVTMSMAREADDDRSPTDMRFKNIITTPIAYDPEIKKKERSKNAQIAIEVNKVKKRANARTILKSYYEEWEENNKLVMSDLKNQRKQLEDKLLAIRTCETIQTRRVRKWPRRPLSYDNFYIIRFQQANIKKTLLWSPSRLPWYPGLFHKISWSSEGLSVGSPFWRDTWPSPRSFPSSCRAGAS